MGKLDIYYYLWCQYSRCDVAQVYGARVCLNNYFYLTITVRIFIVFIDNREYCFFDLNGYCFPRTLIMPRSLPKRAF